MGCSIWNIEIVFYNVNNNNLLENDHEKYEVRVINMFEIKVWVGFHPCDENIMQMVELTYFDEPGFSCLTWYSVCTFFFIGMR